MMEKGKMEQGVVELVDTEGLVPREHLLREVDKAVDFRKLYEIVEPLYSTGKSNRKCRRRQSGVGMSCWRRSP